MKLTRNLKILGEKVTINFLRDERYYPTKFYSISAYCVHKEQTDELSSLYNYIICNKVICTDEHKKLFCFELNSHFFFASSPLLFSEISSPTNV